MLRSSSTGRPYGAEIMQNLDRPMSELVTDDSLSFGLVHRIIDKGGYVPSAPELVDYVEGEGQSRFTDEQVREFYSSNLFNAVKQSQGEYDRICKTERSVRYAQADDIIRYVLLDTVYDNGAISAILAHTCREYHPNRGKRRNPQHYGLLRARSFWSRQSTKAGIDDHKPLTYFDIIISAHRRSIIVPSFADGFTLRELINLLMLAAEDAKQGVHRKTFSLTYYTSQDKDNQRINHALLKRVVPEGTALEWHYAAGWHGRGTNIATRIESIAELCKQYTVDEIMVVLRDESFNHVNDVCKYVRAGISLDTASNLNGKVTPSVAKKMLAQGIDAEFIIATYAA